MVIETGLLSESFQFLILTHFKKTQMQAEKPIFQQTQMPETNYTNEETKFGIKKKKVLEPMKKPEILLLNDSQNNISDCEEIPGK